MTRFSWAAAPSGSDQRGGTHALGGMAANAEKSRHPGERLKPAAHRPAELIDRVGDIACQTHESLYRINPGRAPTGASVPADLPAGDSGRVIFEADPRAGDVHV